MTTAARPTFEPARGGTGKGDNDLSALSKQYSSRDLPGQTKLKYRQTGQDTKEEVSGKDLKRELDDKERSSKRHRVEAKRGSRVAAEPLPRDTLDQDEPFDSSSDNSSSDEDETGELLAELARIKKERANELQRKEVERSAEAEKIRKETILSGNPLLNLGSGSGQNSDFSVKRRWDDDVVFKNCAKGHDEDGKNDRFINDTLRSEFHKKFMSKYIK